MEGDGINNYIIEPSFRNEGTMKYKERIHDGLVNSFHSFLFQKFKSEASSGQKKGTVDLTRKDVRVGDRCLISPAA